MLWLKYQLKLKLNIRNEPQKHLVKIAKNVQ